VKLGFKQVKDLLTGFAGLSGVGSLIELTNLKQRLSRTHLQDNSRPDISHGDVATSYLGLLCQGKPDFDHIEAFREDEWFSFSLGLKKVPSSPTLRQRLDQGAQHMEWNPIIRDENANLLRLSKTSITPVQVGEKAYVPLDVDVSPFDNSGTKKQGISWTYKGFEGYSPIFAYLGQEGYCVNVELREGKDHSQKGALPFLAESIRLSKTVTDQPLLLRMDSGHDCRDNLALCIQQGVDCIIKRNLRREQPAFLLEYAKRQGIKAETERPGKTVYRFVKPVQITVNKKKYHVNMVYIVTERTVLANGQILLTPELEMVSYWTTLPATAERIDELYHAHATSEQFHSEIKTDMDLERLPSGKFETNQLILTLGMFAYNLLRIMGQHSVHHPATPLRKKAERRRIRTVIQNLVTCAAKLIKHSRQITLGFASNNPWFAVIKSIYEHFSSLAGNPA